MVKKTKARQPDKIDVAAGEVLKSLRNSNKITQEEIADAIGVTFQQIQKYEKGRNRISMSKLFAICKVLQIDPSTFVGIVESHLVD